MSTIVAFGAGGDEPYAVLLGYSGSSRLAIRKVDDPRSAVEVDVAEWMAPANDVDLAVLDGCTGPLLDVGCGPGRMVRAAEERALPALGIDISAEATAYAAADGTPVLRRSVFDRLPLEGQWNTVLLMDGNIGIGGDPAALLSRCAELLSASGCIVVEVDGDTEMLECAQYLAVGYAGRQSAPFPWARVGAVALARLAVACGLAVADAWTSDARCFVTLRAQRLIMAEISSR
jgi:SAM-dependent methyltransferase